MANNDVVQGLAIKLLMDRAAIEERQAQEAINAYLKRHDESDRMVVSAWKEASELVRFQPFSDIGLNDQIVLGSYA